MYGNERDINVLEGRTLKRIEGLTEGSEDVTFTSTDGTQYRMYHQQDCCEMVDINEIFGDVEALIGHPILRAEERTSGNNPEDYDPEYQDSFTWTFYELATIKGSVTIRWYGESNGYYSEDVSFIKM